MDGLEALAADALARCEQLFIPNVGCPYYMPRAYSAYEVRMVAGAQSISEHPPGEGRGLVTVEAACTYPIDDMLAKHPEIAETVNNALIIRPASTGSALRPGTRTNAHRCQHSA